MTCPRCKADNRDGARFCRECGATFGAVCSSCGTKLEPGSKFCDSCGAPLAAGSSRPVTPPRFASPEHYTPEHLAARILSSRAALEGERKQVTVLFADLKGSMELLADRDPEEGRKLLDPVLDLMMEAVHRYEGTVNQVMGDGIMALFGAPLAHEDHAVRACYAALRMQESVKRYTEDSRRRAGVALAIRVGLNSGEVVVRSIGSDLRMDYTAVGQTTHVAARMEQAALPGSILVTPDTLRLAEGHIEVKALGPIPVKGLVEPLDAYELTGAGTARTRFQAKVSRGLSPFVGRDAELEVLRRALVHASEGQGQVVAVVGEPGVGKSRLYWEFTHSHRTQGWLILESGSVSYGRATPYLPVIDLFKNYFRIGEGDEPREIREKVIGKLLALERSLEAILSPFLALLDLPVEDTEWVELDPLQRRQRTIDAVKRLLIAESRIQPTLVLFEDLHWVDTESQGVLEALVESLPATRLLLLVNYRPEYQHGWGGKTYYSQVRLDALPPDNAAELLDALLGEAPALDGLKHLLVAHTAGNALFLEESVRALVETRILAGARGAYRLARPVEAIDVPPSVQAVLAARIDRLEPEDKRLLQAAAVVGKDVPYGVLLAIADRSDDDLGSGLARLQASEFLYEAALFPDLEYTFKHALTHDVAYGGILLDRRRALHAGIVEAIERLYPDRLAEHDERLAHHALQGDLWDKAVRYSRQAGLKALDRSANREATAHFRRALSALQRWPEGLPTLEMGVDLRLDLYLSMLPLDELRPVLEYLREAESLAGALEDRRRQGWAWLHISHLLILIGDCSECIEMGRRALAVADAAGMLRITANLWLGCAHYALGDHRRSLEMLRLSLGGMEAEEQEEQHVRRVPVLVTVRSYLAMFHAEVGEFAAGRPLAAYALRIAEAVDRPWSLMLACWQVGEYHLAKGELDRAASLLQRTIELGQRWALPRTPALAGCARGYALALSGRAAEGLEALEQGVAQLDASGFTWLRGRRLSYLGEAYLLAGRADEAKAAAQQALAFSRQRKERGFEAWALRLLAEIAARAASPDAPAAEALYGRALALAEELQMRPLVAHCHLGLGRLYGRAGDAPKADDHLGTAGKMYREMDMPFWLEQAGCAQ